MKKLKISIVATLIISILIGGILTNNTIKKAEAESENNIYGLSPTDFYSQTNVFQCTTASFVNNIFDIKYNINNYNSEIVDTETNITIFTPSTGNGSSIWGNNLHLDDEDKRHLLA